MKSKKLLAIILLCIMTCIPVIFIGCTNPWKVKREEKGFYYAFYDKYGDWTGNEKKAVSAVILGRTDDQKAVNELIIPQKLGGFPVKQIGGIFRPLEGGDEFYSINCENVGKIIINHSCTLTNAFSCLSGELEINADVLIDTADQFVFYSYRTIRKLIRFNVDLRSLTDYEKWSDLWNYDWGVAADKELKLIEFNAAGGQQKTYAYVAQMNMSVLPPEPPTKEGYSFAGWYDEDYEREWDFDTDKVTENITLYAKWIKNRIAGGVELRFNG